MAQTGEAAGAVTAHPVLTQPPLPALIHIHTAPIGAAEAFGARLYSGGVPGVAGLTFVHPPGGAAPPAADVLCAQAGQRGAALSVGDAVEAVPKARSGAEAVALPGQLGAVLCQHAGGGPEIAPPSPVPPPPFGVVPPPPPPPSGSPSSSSSRSRSTR